MTSMSNDSFNVAIIERLTGIKDEISSLNSKISGFGNEAKLISEIRDEEETNDTRINGYREYMDALEVKRLEAQKTIEEYIRSANADRFNAEDGVSLETLEAELKTQLKTYKSALTLAGDLKVEVPEELMNVKGVRVITRRGAQTPGGGTAKLRLSEVWFNGEHVGRTLTEAIKAKPDLGLSPKDVVEAVERVNGDTNMAKRSGEPLDLIVKGVTVRLIPAVKDVVADVKPE